jgi:hypothetical protein
VASLPRFVVGRGWADVAEARGADGGGAAAPRRVSGAAGGRWGRRPAAGLALGLMAAGALALALAPRLVRRAPKTTLAQVAPSHGASPGARPGHDRPQPAQPRPPLGHGGVVPASPAGAGHDLPARGPARPARVPGHVVPDDRYLDGTDPALTRSWGGSRGRDARAIEVLLGRLSPMRDDFVTIPPPMLAALDPRGTLAAAALKAWKQEAQKVDPRLARQVTLALKATAVDEFCAAMREQTGVRLRASRGVGDEKVTLFVRERPARDVMRAVARLFGYKWLRTGEEGEWSYELSQDLKTQLAEEEMRNRDLHAALLALDDRMAQYRPYLERSFDQLAAQYDRAQGKEKQLIGDLVKMGGWGPAQLYFRLSPAERSALMSSETLRFSADDRDADRRLPAEWRTPLLKSTGLGYFPAGTIVPAEHAHGKPFTPIDQIAAAQPSVAFRMDRSEAGEFTLHAGTHVNLSKDGKIVAAGGFLYKIASGRPPSMDRPDNAKENRVLRDDPLFRPVISLDPRPSCPRVVAALRGRPSEMEQIYLEPDIREPHLSSADAWEEIYRRTGIPIVADSYTHLFPLAKIRLKDASTFDTLCHTGDELGMRWKKDGDFLLCRSASYFWDKLKEVPNRLLARWRQDSDRNGGLPLGDLLEMVTLPDLQLGSRTVGKGIVHCWGLEEWGIIGGGPFTSDEGIASFEMRKMARALTVLSPQQFNQALSPAGLPMAACAPAQREEIGKVLRFLIHEGPALEQCRLRVEYIPAGRYLWHPVVTMEQYNAGAKNWPLVAGKSAAEALAGAQRYDPSATEEKIRRTRGRLDFTFLRPNGEMRTTGGPAVLVPLE